MGIFSGIVNYQNFEVESGITSNFFISPTISANTISGGELSALYVASGKVTNQEFKYLSGTTSNIQIQLNSLSNIGEPFLTFSSSTLLTNEKVLTEGPGLSIDEFGDKLVVNTLLTSTEFVYINFAMTDPSYTAITNWNPTGFEVNNNTRATHIIIGGGDANSYPSVISGLTGGTNGRIVFISNFNTGLPMIFENNSTKCPYSCRFTFSMNEAFFLSQRGTLSLIYDGDSQSWKELYPVSRESMFDVYDDFNRRVPYTFSSSNFGNGLIGRIYYGQGIYGYTGFSDTSSVIYFKSTAAIGPTLTQYNSSFCPGRANFSNGISSSFVTKVCIDGTYSNSLELNNSVSVCNIGQTKNYSSICTGAFNNAVTSHWLTSGSTWVNFRNGIVYQTDLNLSDTIFNFVFLGISVNKNRTAFFYSKNGNEYKISNVLSAPVSDGIGGIGMGSRNTGTTITPTLFCDWYGLKIQ